MRGSLFIKLLLAFAVVILVVTVIVSILANRAAASEFRLYTTRSGQFWAEQLVPLLADYYARSGSWEGVTGLLQGSTGMMMADGGMMGPDMMGMHGEKHEDWAGDMWTMMGQRLILANTQRTIVADTMDTLVGESLSTQEVATGLPITVNGRSVGTLIVVSAVDAVEATSPASQFLRSVNRSILWAALAAGLTALVIGGLLFFNLTAPVRQLMAATQAIASGDLGHRVPVRSQDELGGLARNFNTMTESLARSEEQRRQMVADIAHELRTPISIIQGNLEAMLDNVLPLNAEQVSLVHEETLLLGRLVADLKLLSLADTGQLNLERRETDLGKLVGKVVERMTPQAREKAVALELDLPATLPLLFVDPDRITQVIDNLVSNALRYTPAGGRVAIHASVGEAAGGGQQPSVTVAVSDTGSGIAPQDLPHIFDRFYRADKSRSRGSGGSGLGLAIVKHLVEAHGGRVWAESPLWETPGEPAYGTRVSFTLPIAGRLTKAE